MRSTASSTPPSPLAFGLLFASACMVLGMMWDVSWHMTVGRDGLFSPPHLPLYLGGLIAGLGSGVHVLRMTFAGRPHERAETVTLWGVLRGRLGAWMSIWGALAILTATPFDDWWHNAYGLDVRMDSPPHSVAALGITGIIVGATSLIASYHNRARDAGRAEEAEASSWYLVLAFGFGIVGMAVLLVEWHVRVHMHASVFYTSSALAFTWILVMAARLCTLRWAATGVAAVYTVVRAVGVWVLPLFPAEPRLGPILQPVEVFVPMDFPLLLIVPAVGIDWVVQRWRADPGGWADWGLAAVTGVLFLGALLAVQWPFADFLMSEGSRNWFFGTEHVPYWLGDTNPLVQNRFLGTDDPDRWKNIGLAFLYAVGSARVGLWIANWLGRVRR